MNILYEDAFIVVLDKPAGLSSEEGVPAALRQLWNAPDAFVGVVHRLDTGVSGLMVFARTPGAAAALSRQITQSQNAKDSRRGRVFPVSRPRKGVREAVLEYRILKTTGNTSLAGITLHTGRTHQIRVQFAARKHPLSGDGKYGSRVKGDIALQSCGLQFRHPDTGKPLQFSLPLPDAAPWKEFLE